MPTLKPYVGPSRKIVLAFDVGTTFSGISYAILDPGETPKIQSVTRFPGQENGDFKIPSVLWYTQEGEMRAAGAEARASAMTLIAEDEDLIFVEWFKLHLRPDAMQNDAGLSSDVRLPALPPGKTVIHVFADFLRYLYRCTRAYIEDTHPNGASLWASVEAHAEIVLSHPNGWEGSQQSKMRQAAVLAGLVPNNTAGHERVHFVSEGEASLNYCLDSGLAADAIAAGRSVMIIDAGGGTVDLSTYLSTASNPVTVEETAPADCIFQGSTRINVRAQKFLSAFLKNSRYGNEEDVKSMMDSFEKSVKPTFKDPIERSFVKFGSIRDKDPDVGIRSGQLLMNGSDVESFFEPSIIAIVEAVKKQRLAASEPVFMALLVGGFAASPWLFARLKGILQEIGIQLSRPDNHTNKAVAEGAVIHFLGSVVAVRVARLTYGATCVKAYNPSDPEHTSRASKLTSRPSGRLTIPGGFTAMLIKGTRMRDQEEVSFPFFQETPSASLLNSISADITCYRGAAKEPRWTDEEPERFSTLCTVRADTSRVIRRKKQGPNGTYYQQAYKIVLSCGLTEMKAQISWMEEGVEKRGPASIVYDDDAIAG
ncbi:hypothetical protein BDW22DRAFT_1337232 [Trametopsis cervina]|nr:hypothetical protein BDW22DRAFT_1337232 [Trametopsis cervina]